MPRDRVGEIMGRWRFEGEGKGWDGMDGSKLVEEWAE